jgi:hypothetical protein
MPERRDYLQRMIGRVMAELTQVRAEIAAGEFAAAQEELRGVVRRVGLDLDMVVRMSAETLLVLLSVGADPDPARCLLVAEVLAVEADRTQAANFGAEVAQMRAKAVVLLRAAQPHLGRDDQDAVAARIATLSPSIAGDSALEPRID